MDLAAFISEQARALGFVRCGFAPAGPAPEWERFREWLDLGYAGGMEYLAARAEERRDVRAVWPPARSVVALAYPAPALPQMEPAPNEGIIAAYALGRDYHTVLHERMRELLERIRVETGGAVDGVGYVDSGPLLETALARQAGLGWKGRHTLVIHPECGSRFFLGELLLDCELPVAAEPVPDRCGTCTRCMDACPTGAIVAPGLLDARRCISYLTIEHRGAISRGLRPLMGAHVFGCDVCQDVCPWNRRLDGAPEPERPDLARPDLTELLLLSGNAFKRRFAGTPVLRARRKGLARNAAIALGNVGDERALPALTAALEHDADPVVRSHAGWALARIVGAAALGTLQAAAEREPDADARADLMQTAGEADLLRR